MDKNLVYCVDTTDNVKVNICVFDNTDDKEALAKAINGEVKATIYVDEYEDPERLYEVGRGLAYNGYAKYHEYEFGIETIAEIIP
jgi:hypothetical protein